MGTISLALFPETRRARSAGTARPTVNGAGTSWLYPAVAHTAGRVVLNAPRRRENGRGRGGSALSVPVLNDVQEGEWRQGSTFREESARREIGGCAPTARWRTHADGGGVQGPMWVDGRGGRGLWESQRAWGGEGGSEGDQTRLPVGTDVWTDLWGRGRASTGGGDELGGGCGAGTGTGTGGAWGGCMGWGGGRLVRRRACEGIGGGLGFAGAGPMRGAKEFR